MRAIILAGGRGTRLKPYTTVIPKPLVPVGDRAVLEILLENLRMYGVTNITMCVNHYAELIKAYFGDGSRYGMKIDYSLEDKPLSTVAPIKLLKDLPENFLVMNGDLLTELDFAEFFNFHLQNEGLLTVATYNRTVSVDFGVIDIDPDNNKATGFREKPNYNFNVSMGVYAFNRQLLDYVPENHPFGFDNLMHKMLGLQMMVNIYSYSGYWLDIGRPADYEKANTDIEELEAAHKKSIPIGSHANTNNYQTRAI
ncbi:MAG: NTP transferase domain-containing protein [Fibrobacter sp.]|nr:NTP transferase domain-containing protein [Fibrobacter sp.]